MNYLKFYLIFTFIIFPPTTYSQNCCSQIELYKTSIVNNVLNLSNEQIELQKHNSKEFQKHLTKDQKNKYKTITKLIKNDQKKRVKNYYKSNPKLQYFGNPASCQKMNERQK